VQHIVHSALFEFFYPVFHGRVTPNLRHVTLDEIPADLFGDLARFDDIVSAGFMVRFGMGNHMENIRFHVELSVDTKSQVAFSLI